MGDFFFFFFFKKKATAKKENKKQKGLTEGNMWHVCIGTGFRRWAHAFSNIVFGKWLQS